MPRRQLSRGEIDDLLRRLPVGHLGLTLGGLPYVVPLHFVYEDGKVYFHSKGAGRKLDCIRGNPRVCFEASELISLVPGQKPCNCGAEYESVIIQGSARLLEDRETRLRVLAALTRKYAPELAAMPMPDQEVARTVVVEISPTEVTGKSLRRRVDAIAGAT